MLKLNIFILEDSKERIDYFKKQFDNHNLTICMEINDEVYNTLDEKRFDILFLDHDLENYIFGHKDDGTTIAKYLTTRKLQSHAIIYVHSMNPIGANNMVKILNDAGYEAQWIPFHLLIQSGLNK
jgi:hypothetical protein